MSGKIYDEFGVESALHGTVTLRVRRDGNTQEPRVWVYLAHLAYDGAAPCLTVPQTERLIAALQSFVNDATPQDKNCLQYDCGALSAHAPPETEFDIEKEAERLAYPEWSKAPKIAAVLRRAIAAGKGESRA